MIGKELIDSDAIAARVGALGAQISVDYAGKIPVLVGILDAAATFLADLSRAVTVPCEFDFIALSSHSDAEGIRFEKDAGASIEGRHVIVVDDTVNTGTTLRYITKTLAARAPASLATCVLLDRPLRRTADTRITYRGFEVPDQFMVGYGLDYLGRFRELPSLFAYGAGLA